jgi:D-aminopeptidase
MKYFKLLCLLLLIQSSVFGQKPRARDIGIPFNGKTGKFNAITDVKGVEVGYSTIISGQGKNVRGKGPVRTGVTAILPRGRNNNPVFSNWYSLNGNGEMTGTIWITESGFLEGPVMITNTNSVGVVRDAVLKWYVKTGWYKEDFWYTYPVVAETYDGFLNDIYGFHVKESNAYEALDSAKTGFLKEGNVGGGTGMMCLGFKGGTGTASRVVEIKDSTYTVGVLVQSNFGGKKNFTIAGVPIGKELKDTLNYEFKSAPSYRQDGDGSIIVVVATDAPLLPHQLKRIAARVPIGVGIVGGRGENSSGDIFIAFSTANPSAFQREDFTKLDELPNDLINPLFEATVQAVEEAIINAMVAAETMEGINGNKVYGLPHNLVKDLLKKYNRTFTPVKTIAVASDDLDKYLGIYSSTDIPLKMTITKKGNILIAKAEGQSSLELAAIDKDKFTADEVGVILEFNPSNKSMILKLDGKKYSFRKE